MSWGCLGMENEFPEGTGKESSAFAHKEFSENLFFRQRIVYF